MENSSAVRRDRGFALVLAMLSLMLLTFLGLTLAATTSTELQIATNYRWSQQALYNAEAGLEAARVALANQSVSNPVQKWAAVMPQVRTSPYRSWRLSIDTPPPPLELPGSDPDFKYLTDCDSTRYGMGYGLVLSIPGGADGLGVVDRDGTVGRFHEVSRVAGQPINGAFTIWIRRPTDPDRSAGGRVQDSDLDDDAILVSEGIAPFTRSDSAFARTRQASRTLEARYNLIVSRAGCRNEIGQEGSGPSGSGYNSCAPLYADMATEMIGGAFEAGNVTATGNR